MTNKPNILGTYGVLHAPDGSILQRGVTIIEETRPEGIFLVIEGKAFPINKVRRLKHPMRLVFSDGTYAMP